MIVDFRVNPPYAGWLNTYFFRQRPVVEDPVSGNPFAWGRRSPPSFEERSLEAFLEEMDAARVNVAVVTGQQAASRWGSVPNDDVARLARLYPGRFVPFAGIDPASPDALREVERALGDLGCRGIAMQPGWSDPPLHNDDSRILSHLCALPGSGAPVIVTTSQFIGLDQTWAMPHRLQHVAQMFPQLTLIVSHGCWPWTTQACGLAMICTNVYLMPDFYLYLPQMPGALDYVGAANTWLGERVLYSSCYPSRPLEQALAHFGDLPLTARARSKVLGENAVRLLKLDPGTVQGRLSSG